jgi:hypothetical protein
MCTVERRGHAVAASAGRLSHDMAKHVGTSSGTSYRRPYAIVRQFSAMSTFRISSALWDKIHYFASFPQTGVSLQQMVLFGQNPSQGTLLRASQFLAGLLCYSALLVC